jgi:hypothetical protein
MLQFGYFATVALFSAAKHRGNAKFSDQIVRK